jgi:anaerobic sulfite reductase subunit B
MVPTPYRVARRRRETHDTWTLELEPAGDDAVAAFGPGQFAMLYAFGAGEVPISVSALPSMHTVRDMGAVSAALCRARRGEVLGLRGPFGTSWPVETARGSDIVVLAGGIGLAPLRPVVPPPPRTPRALRPRRRALRRPLARGAAVHRRARALARALRGRGHRRPGRRRLAGRVGVVTTLVPRATFDPDHPVAMICGPEVMMRFAVAALRERCFPSEAILVSLERGTKCAVGSCGHCQLGRAFVCKDGPVFRWDAVEPLLRVREL